MGSKPLIFCEESTSPDYYSLAYPFSPSMRIKITLTPKVRMKEILCLLTTQIGLFTSRCQETEEPVVVHCSTLSFFIRRCGNGAHLLPANTIWQVLASPSQPWTRLCNCIQSWGASLQLLLLSPAQLSHKNTLRKLDVIYLTHSTELGSQTYWMTKSAKLVSMLGRCHQ